ncbi:MAG: hypothetical protein ACRDJE_18985 [Dehalococcoidia bacterium]
MTYAPIESQQKGSVLSAAIWMIVLSILLFWLPVLGPLIAGVVGGYKARDLGRALLAASLPALLIAILVLLLATLTGLPLVGALAGAGIFIGIVLSSLPLFVGAALGALLS